MTVTMSRGIRGGALCASLAMALLLAAPAAPLLAAEGGAALVDEARARIRKKDVRGALGSLEKAIAADPANADAHILYQDVGKDALGAEAILTKYRQYTTDKPDDPVFAFLFARLLSPGESLAEFDKQIKKFPASPWPHAGKARSLERLERGAEAGAEYDAAIMASPGDSRFRAYQAYGMERAGNWAGAADAWKQILASSPKDRAARLGLGEALRKTGALDEAIAAFGEAVKADPADAEAHYRVGVARMDAGSTEEALKSFDAALAIDRTFVEAYCSASEVAISHAFATAEKEKRDIVEKDFERAIGYAGKAAAVGSDRWDAHFALGAAHEAVGELGPGHYDTAAVEYDSAIALLPLPSAEKVRALCAKAFVLLRLLKFDQALVAAEKALGIDDKCVAAHAHAGYALCAMARQDDAIKDHYRPGLKIAPDDARLHHALGVALWETAKDMDAKKELELAVKLEPKNVRYRLTYGELLYHLKLYKPALEQLFEVTDAHPNDVEAWRSYGRVCSALKYWKEAAESYEKICELIEGAPPAAPAAGGDPGAAPATPPALSAAETDLLVKAHLYLAIIYADHLKDRTKAKEHAREYSQLGGHDVNIQSFIDGLLAEK